MQKPNKRFTRSSASPSENSPAKRHPGNAIRRRNRAGLSGATAASRLMSRIGRFYRRTLNASLVIGVVAIFSIIVAQIVCRYLLNRSLVWGEEVSAYIMVWCGLLGAVSHFHKEDFMALTLVEMIGWRPLTRVATVVTIGTSALFIVTLLVAGAHLIVSTSPDTRSAAADLPMNAVYLVMPLFAGLMLLAIPASVRRRRRAAAGDEMHNETMTDATDTTEHNAC